jgi:hypothetical protein
MGIKGRSSEFLYMERKKVRGKAVPLPRRFGLLKCGDCQKKKSMV